MRSGHEGTLFILKQVADLLLVHVLVERERDTVSQPADKGQRRRWLSSCFARSLTRSHESKSPPARLASAVPCECCEVRGPGLLCFWLLQSLYLQLSRHWPMYRF